MTVPRKMGDVPKMHGLKEKSDWLTMDMGKNRIELEKGRGGFTIREPKAEL